MTFQTPTLLNPSELDFDEENDDALDVAQWYFYRYVDDECPAWPGLLATTNREKAKLTNIISDVTILLYGTRNRSIKAHQILKQYARYVRWHEELPHAISNIDDNNSQNLPHVLSLL